MSANAVVNKRYGQYQDRDRSSARFFVYLSPRTAGIAFLFPLYWLLITSFKARPHSWTCRRS